MKILEFYSYPIPLKLNCVVTISDTEDMKRRHTAILKNMEETKTQLSNHQKKHVGGKKRNKD